MIAGINQSFELSLPLTMSYEELQEKLRGHINHLIEHDFEKLVFYLYRIDVDEFKLKQLLELKAGENAAGLMAELVIARQLEKIKTRQQFRQRDNDIDEEDKW